jgi:hypothetical protein
MEAVGFIFGVMLFLFPVLFIALVLALIVFLVRRSRRTP